MRNPPKKPRKSEDLSNFKPQEIAKFPCSPQSTTPKILAQEKRKENILEEFRRKEKEATRNFEAFKPAVQELKPAENFRKPIENMSPVTNLLKEAKFTNPLEKGSEVKKLELNQQKQLKDFFKIKEKFWANSVSPKKEWNYLNNSKALIKNNDENVFYQHPLEKVVGNLQKARFYNILLWGAVFFVFLYTGLFVYHFLRSDPVVFCISKSDKDCIQCPYDDFSEKGDRGRCLNGLLVD